MAITTQNWDGSGSGSSTFSGWTLTSGLASTPTQYVSSPYSLGTVTTGFAGVLNAISTAVDTNGGNVVASTYLYLDNNHHDNGVLLFVRATSNFVLYSTGTAYTLNVENNNWSSGNWQIYLGKQSAGTFAPLASITNILSSTVYSGWYKLTLTVNSTSLSATLQRQSDSYYLNSSGVFAGAVSNCLSYTDSSITGANYYGVTAYAAQSSNASTVYLDNYELDAGSAMNSVMPRPIIVNVPYNALANW